MATKVKNLQVEATPVLTDSVILERIGGPGIQPKLTLLQKIFDLFSVSTSSLSGISAAGTNQSTATALTKNKNRIDTVSSGTGVKDSVTAVSGYTRTVQNNGVNDLLWYPFGTNQFFILGSGLQGAGTPMSIAPGNEITVFCYDAGQLTLI